MPEKSNVSPRVRLVGLWASGMVVAARSVTVLSKNQNAGFGRSITRDEHVFLFLIATLLFGVQVIAYVINRRQAPKNATGPLRSAAPSATKHSSRDL